MIDEFALLGTVKDTDTTFTPLPARFRERTQNPHPETISEMHHFDAMKELVSKYDHCIQSSHQDSMTVIGDMIATDYPFLDRGTGCNTLAGQLNKLSKDNRDCKLPTFLLALSLSRIYPESDIKIVINRLAPFHPIIKIQIGEQIIYGEYVITQRNSKTIFRLLTNEQVASTFYKDRIVAISPDLKGMQMLDEAFIKDKLIS